MKFARFSTLAAAAVLAVGIGGFSAQATASTVTQVPFAPGNLVWPGNDCSGVFGQGFGNCAYNGSPIIAKFNTDPNEADELNTSLFPGLQASWFTINPVAMTWSYNPLGAGPGITAFVAKGGGFFHVYTIDGGPYYGGSDVFSFSTPINPRNGQPFGLSHISFYDSTTVIPVPAALPLMLSGLVGFGLLARRRRNAA